jgi:hypothetical protein
MKNKSRLKKAVFFLVFSSLFILNTYGQNSYIKNRWNIKTGYARYKKGISQEKVGNYRIEVNYGILNYLEIGAYIGYSKFDYYHKNIADSINSGSYRVEDNNTPFYGASFNFHILPFLINKDDFRFDLYVTGKFGGLYFTKPAPYFTFNGLTFKEGQMYEYGIGAGMSYYLGKHLGIFAEYCHGKYYFGDRNKLRYGLTLKF